MPKRMLFRFSLYGFLKNQRYFEPFIMLAFLAKGLSFFEIGLLFGFRELMTNILEIPTGAVADVAGRRRAMIASHVAYLICFLLLGYCKTMLTLLPAMLLFSVGEAFRTGTHKAIIFTWLKHEGRASEKTHVYGYTRSWSKIGSAVSALIAGGLLLYWTEFDAVFYLSAIPMGINLINFLGYPDYLDEIDKDASYSMKSILLTFFRGLLACVSLHRLRRLLVGSMCFEGVYTTCKDYIQPVLKTMALSLPVLLSLSGEQRTAILVALVYAVLFLLGSLASRFSGHAADRLGGTLRAMGVYWWVFVACFGLVLTGVLTHVGALAVVGLVILGVAQNLWRPNLVSAVADEADSQTLATVLSVESQAKTLFAAVVAPILGFTVDRVSASWPEYRFLPIAILGLSIGVVMTLASLRKSARA